MFEHIQILSYVLLILSATWLVFYIQSIYKKYPYGYIKAIRNYNFAVILLFILRFTFFYVRKNLMGELEPGLGPVFLNSITFSLRILMIFMVYLMLISLLKLRGKPLSRNQHVMIFVLQFFIGFLYFINTFLSETEVPILKGLSNVFNDAFIFNLVINNMEFLLILCFFFFWKKDYGDNERKRISKFFALTYILCNSISLGALFLLMYIRMGESMVWIMKVLVMCIFILAPYLWINLIFIPYARTMLKLINREGNIQAIFMRYKISKREAEIIELIIDGKGNNEIKETLFISYHTVKNHLSNIFRKLKVKNRHELVHLFMTSGEMK
jgi:DNA-binding CsgD family transcriptional regulator